MQPSIKTAFILVVFLIAGSAMSYSFLNGHNPTVFHPVGTIDGYDLSSPEFRLELPEILFEISGLTDIDQRTIACVQDEDGLVFFYDLELKKITRQLKFGKEGDYEGITRVGKDLYILRSDGKLFEVRDYESKDFQVEEYDTDIPVKNNEGLGYDSANHRLLIAGKSAPDGDEDEDQRTVYSFDLNTKTVSEKPIYTFSLERIKQFISDSNGAQKNKDEELKIKIYPSAIAIHPHSGQLYVLSSKGKLIYIFNSKGDIEAVHHLEKKMFNQAEGITFLENGDMLISNEGKKDQPTLLLFKYN